MLMHDGCHFMIGGNDAGNIGTGCKGTYLEFPVSIFLQCFAQVHSDQSASRRSGGIITTSARVSYHEVWFE